ncbi:MAG: hypothetical protein A2W26_08605 [Acidobacteria bacterium RBG_16_64_8]|nr:MAG: hypothetical protein A2W26_08605 [Acidobacteria bacterium RBG_16_64_8]
MRFQITAAEPKPVLWYVQVRRRGQAEPVGYPLADFQGPTPSLDCRFEPARVLRSARLATYDFDHLVDPTGSFARWCEAARLSPHVDLSRGFADYLDCLEQQGSGLLRDVRRKERMIQREVGPLNIEHDTNSVDDLVETIERKRAQYRRTGHRDALADPWRQALLHDLLKSASPDCHGVTSRLVAGGKTLSWHFGLRGRSVFHYWFPVIEERWSRFSPGQVLLMGMVAFEAERGSIVVDLGAGDEEYKRRFATGARVVYKGSVCSMPGISAARAARRYLRLAFTT